VWSASCFRSEAKKKPARTIAPGATLTYGEIATQLGDRGAEAHAMDDAGLIDPLTQVRGIGRWTVEMLLIFRLGRPDVLPADDFGIRKGFSVAFKKREMPTPKEVLARGAKWAPYRTIASWYLWRVSEGGS